MATFSTSLCAPTLPELIFLSPNHLTKRLKLSPFGLSNLEPRTKFRNIGTRIKSVPQEESVVLCEKDRELLTKLNGSVNGNGNKHANGNYSYGNGSVENYSNGSLKSGSDNGSLEKYVYGSGNGGVAVRSQEKGVEVAKADKVISHKKTIEEIGQEEAWFKQGGQDQVEVSVAPGGHWSRFKTYSTIQRTLEIWGFILIFLFRIWLNNQKFSLQRWNDR